jgi:hypothetical protein
MSLPAQNVREIAPHNLHRSINAAVSLRQELARLITGDAGGDMAPDDLEALRDTFDGQTTLDAEIRRAVLAIEEDEILIAGMKARETELKNRRLRIEKRIEATRGLIEQAMTVAEWPKHEMDIGTVTIGKAAPRLEIDDESQIPSQFWKPADPSLDKAGLKKVLSERQKALQAISKLSGEARTEALLKIDKEFPPIDGAHLETDGVSLTIRRA